MADIYSNLELVNNAVQEAGAGDKRNRNNAIRKGLENPGLYQSGGVQPTSLDQTLSTVGTQPNIASQPSWNAPQQWADYYWDVANAPSSSIMQDAFGGSMLNGAGADTRDLSKEDVYKRINEESKAYRSKGFIPDNQQAQDYLKAQGWTYYPGYRDTGTGHGNATPEVGAGVWTKANPNAYKGQGQDWVTYSPTRGYGQGQYLKKAPQKHGIGGFLQSPGGMILMSILGAGLGAGGLGALFGEAGGAAGMGGALGNGITLGGASAGIGGGALGSGISLGASGAGIAGGLGSGLSAGAGLAGVMGGINGASALGSGGLFGKGGILGTGIDTGSGLANSGIENFGKSLLTSGGDVKKSGINALTGGLSSGLGGLFDSDIGRYVSSISKPLIGTALSGGDMSAGLKNALFGGASAGLGSLLNSTDLMSGNTQEKNALANNATSLVQTLSRKRKVA